MAETSRSIWGAVSAAGDPRPVLAYQADVLAQVLRDGALENVSVQAMFAPMRAASLQEWWERVPKLAGPLAMALAGMETDVRAAIRDRALAAGAEAVRSEETAIVFEGCVLIASGRTPDG